jgi:hypothetical protein
MNGLNLGSMLMVTLAQFQVLDSLRMKINLLSGDQFLFITGMLIEKFTVDNGI